MIQVERVLLKLSKLEILHRDMICNLLNVGVRRVNSIMAQLHKEGLTSHIEHSNGRIYKLSKRGADLMGVNYMHGWSLTDHKIMRNWILLHESDIEIEEQVKIGDVAVIPDAIIKGMMWKFIEVDRTQKWQANIDKLERYAALKNKGSFQKRDGRFPIILWMVEMESRIPKIKEQSTRLGLQCEIYNKNRVRV